MSTNDILNAVSGISIGTITLAKLIPAVFSFVICFVAIKLVSKLLDKFLVKSKKLDGTLQGFVRSTVKTVLWIITAIIVADALGIPTTSLVALVSVVGLAMFLFIQNTMSNLFSGVTLLVTKPFVAGDFVDVAGKTGAIKTVGLFYTVLDTLDNRTVSIPNSDVTSSAVTNYSTEPLRRVDMSFSASYENGTDAVKASIFKAIGMDGRILAEPAPFVALSAYKSSSVDYVVRVWCENQDYWGVYFGLNENVRKCFGSDGIEMTYEHMNVHIVEK